MIENKEGNITVRPLEKGITSTCHDNIFGLALGSHFCVKRNLTTIQIPLKFALFFRFGLSTNLQILLYPQLLYPLSNISLTASIYLIVAITLERYCAVHYPVDYRQVHNWVFERCILG